MRVRRTRCRGGHRAAQRLTAAVPALVVWSAWSVPTFALAAEVGVLTVVCVVCVLTLLGSTLHVKSMMRERRDPRFLHACRTFALACVPAVAVVADPLELAGFLLVAGVALVAV